MDDLDPQKSSKGKQKLCYKFVKKKRWNLQFSSRQGFPL